MWLFTGIRKIGRAVNPIETAKPGARLIKESFKQLSATAPVGLERIGEMSPDDRRAIAANLRQYGEIVAVAGVGLALVSAWAGVSQGSAGMLVSSLIIVTGSFVIALLKFWQADMVANRRPLGLRTFIRNLFVNKDERQ